MKKKKRKWVKVAWVHCDGQFQEGIEMHIPRRYNTPVLMRQVAKFWRNKGCTVTWDSGRLRKGRAPWETP